MCVSVHTSGMCCWARWRVSSLSCPALSCRYHGPVCCVGGWDELLRHEDRPQQRHLPPLLATQQSTWHWVRQVRAENIRIHTHTHTHTENRSAQSHRHKHTRSSYWVMVYISKQKQTLPICERLKRYANAAVVELPLTAAHKQWKQNNCV